MRHVRLRLALALALASRARAAPAPELMKVALAGSGHLQAYGVPYSDNHAHTLAGPTPLHFRPPQNLDLPIPSSSSAAGALRAAARAGVLLPAPGACNDYPVPFASCNFTCSVCQADPGGVTKVTCVDPGSGKVGLGENAVAATAIREAVSAVTLLLDVGPGHRDCACIQPVARVESANCTLLGSYCLYFPSASASASGFTPLLRAKVWDAASPKYIGASKGWGEPADGYNATIPSAPYDSTLAAARAMRAANPARKCNPGKVTPLVLIPGLTSSAINYKLTSSTPPAWAFWCERTTDGWVPLWPLDTATASKQNSQLARPLGTTRLWVWAVSLESVGSSAHTESSCGVGTCRWGERTEAVLAAAQGVVNAWRNMLLAPGQGRVQVCVLDGQRAGDLRPGDAGLPPKAQR